MARRYAWLFAITVAVGMLLVLVARVPRRAAAPVSAPVVTPAVALALEIGEGTVSPAAAHVAKGARVTLSVTNRGRRPASLTLAGYEDRLRVGPLAPGALWRGELVADRPGEDFTWLVDGKPAGRLSVTGSHLVDGHR